MTTPYPGSADDRDEARVSWEDTALAGSTPTAEGSPFPSFQDGRYQPSLEQARFGRFVVRDTLGWAFRAFKNNAAALVIAAIPLVLLTLAQVAVSVMEGIRTVHSTQETMKALEEGATATDPVMVTGVESSPLGIILQIVTFIVTLLMTIGFCNAAVKILYGQKISVGDVFEFRNGLKVFGLQLLVGIVSVIGLFLFILPGLVWMYFTALAVPALFLLHHAGVFGAIKGSFKCVSANLGATLGLGILLVLIMTGCTLLFVIPMLFAYPFFYLALMYAFQTSLKAPVYNWT